MACDDATTTSDALLAAVQGPLKVASDAGSVEQHALSDLIKADQYTRAKCASTGRRRGLRFNRLTPDGTVQD